MSRVASAAPSNNPPRVSGPGDQARVASAVQTLLNDKNITRNAAADLIGMTPSAFEARMTGRTDFYVHELAVICAHLETPLGELLDRED